jgi:ABC-type Mn2+/Zn2+ transport system ATPase subunit
MQSRRTGPEAGMKRQIEDLSSTERNTVSTRLARQKNIKAGRDGHKKERGRGATEQNALFRLTKQYVTTLSSGQNRRLEE